MRRILLVGLSVIFLAACGEKPATDGTATPLGTSDLKVPPAGAGEKLFSSEVAPLLDSRDRVLAANAEFEALDTLEAGASREWKNQDSGHSGSIVPAKLFSVNQYNCRDFTHHVVVKEKTYVVQGSACQHPDGTWRPL